MRVMWFFLIFFSAFSPAGELKTYEYTLGSEEYFVIENVKEGSIPEVLESAVSTISIEESEEEDYLERKRKRAADLKSEEYLILDLVRGDRYFELKEFLGRRGALEKLNAKLTVVDTFKYPLHQAILNKSYRVLFVLLNYEGLKIDLVEDSGRTTMELMELGGYSKESLGREVIQKYLNKQKGANI